MAAVRRTGTAPVEKQLSEAALLLVVQLGCLVRA
jgi:hypothetical protein